MAEKRKITKKVISKSLGQKVEVPHQTVQDGVPRQAVERATESGAPHQTLQDEARPKKVCYFCQNKVSPSYTELVSLRKFMTDRAKILPKGRSGVCSRHQRAVAKNIKYARHLALFPFVPKV